MASKYTEIRDVLETTLDAISDMPDIFWENMREEPVVGTPYITARLVPTLRRPETRGLTPLQRYQGFFQVIVYCPSDSGPQTCESHVNTIIEAFDTGSDLTYNGTTLRIEYAERTQGFVDGPWYYIPVNIGWYYFCE